MMTASFGLVAIVVGCGGSPGDDGSQGASGWYYADGGWHWDSGYHDGGHSYDGGAHDSGTLDGAHPDGGTSTDGGAADSGHAVDSGGGTGGGAITCPGPGSYTRNGGSCGLERWAIKTGTDTGASQISLIPQPTTIATLVGLPPNGGGTSRSSPVETTLYELKDVTLTMIKQETDSDYHMVLSDGPHTMIAELAYPDCASGSAWSCFISDARATLDAHLTPSGSPQYPGLTVTVRGVGFFDSNHGQTGVAPNAVELHPVLQICFGQGCTPQ